METVVNTKKLPVRPTKVRGGISRKNFLIFILVTIIFFMGYNFISPDALDLGRYYETAERWQGEKIRHYPINCVNDNAKEKSIVKFKD